MHVTSQFISNTMCNNETQPGAMRVHTDHWCILCCPDDDKTMAGNDVNGDPLKQKHCTQGGGVSWESGWQWIKNASRNNGSRRYWQHLRLQADASVRKKKKKSARLDYLDSCAAGTKATAHLDVPKASSNRDGRLDSNSCPLIFFRHLFALGLPDVSCLASAHF